MARQRPLVPAETAEHTIEIRKSRFIARAGYTDTRTQALTLLAQVRQAHPEARHHCWAYVLGDPVAASGAAMNDDGEPSGTAGRPILNVIQHKGIGDIMVVVTRYFGGIKLGAGGLVRAYAGATEGVLSRMALVRHEPHVAMRVTAGFADEHDIRHWASTHGVAIVDVAYVTQVVLTLDVPETVLSSLEALCAARGLAIEPADG